MFKKIIATVLAASLLATSCLAAESTNITPTRTGDTKLLDAYNSNVSVYVIGDYDFTTRFDTPGLTRESTTTLDFTASINRIESLSEIPTIYSRSGNNAHADAIVIADNVADIYLTAEKASLDNLLSDGYIVYFPQTNYSDMTGVFESIAGTPFNMTPVDDSTDTVVAFVIKDVAGKYYTGNIILSENCGQEMVDSQILKATASNRDLHSTGKNVDLSDAVRSGGSNFDIDYEWNELSGWHQNIYTSPSGHEFLTEWLNFLSVRGSDGNNYYAFAAEAAMDPSVATLFDYCSDYLKYESDADFMQSGVQLRSYEPQAKPSKSDASFSLGLSLAGPSISFSQTWEINDLDFTDNSTPSNQYCKLYWDYERKTNYSEQTTWNRCAMIFKDTKNASSYKFHHFRESALYESFFHTNDTIKADYWTEYTFKP